MKESFRVSRMNIVLLCVMTGIVLLYGIFGTYGEFRRLQAARDEGVQLADRLRVQELLNPVYTQLLRSLDAEDGTESLRLPESRPLGEDKSRDLFSVFSGPAREAGLVLVSLLPDTDAFDPRSGRLSLTLILSGEVQNFYRYLRVLGSLPFVDQFLFLEIRRPDGNLQMRVRLQIRMVPQGGRE
ncbi:hypothetical protein OOT00_10765 [Desulfobotulus sp. H1]|uniref:General secretion pathway protein GspM n=1 Tax=Desulfobotulus pelophilus TaxID=2823377 RepID=A0ABT3NAH4_9BACT|nr:hypothetical protein [Desulfobotulus pelophilus]MCW7754466.1 hypothetical protein [Desulfobotulus pelophilus]